MVSLAREAILPPYSAFQIDELHRHSQNFVGSLHATSLLWSTDMKTAVIEIVQFCLRRFTICFSCLVMA